MKNRFCKLGSALLFASCMLTTSGLISCSDDYIYDEQAPEGWGNSIYGYLKEQGNYTNFVKLIDELNYTDVLDKTGSVTLFVADDEAFNKFYEKNSWGVTKYEDLNESQKKNLLFSSMINNAYLLEMLSSKGNSSGDPLTGQSLRTNTSNDVINTVSWVDGATLPVNNTCWSNWRSPGNGLYLAKDGTSIPMLHFIDDQLKSNNITNADINFILKKDGLTRQDGETFVFNNKVLESDITCKNGYINKLSGVLLPPSNMAEVIRTSDDTKVFSSILERFSAPYASSSLSADYIRLNKDVVYTNPDSLVYEKRYFSQRSKGSGSESNSELAVDNEGNTVKAQLLFDPGWNSYYPQGVGHSYQNDMGVMFVPTDNALNDYFTNGGGAALINRYGSLDAIPLDVIAPLINNQMKPSFVNSVPSKFSMIMDDARDPMGIKESDIDRCELASNGLIYITNKVFPPAKYRAVSAPALYENSLKVFNWAINNIPSVESNFDAYLLAMGTNYSFICPTDDALEFYVDPVTLGRKSQKKVEALKFYYDEKSSTVNAKRMYIDTDVIDPATGHYMIIKDSVGVYKGTNQSSIIKDRLQDLLDYSVVIGNIEDGNSFYKTKGNGFIKVDKAVAHPASGKVSGGLNIEIEKPCNVTNGYDMTQENGNGRTYIVDDPIQPATKSVYDILSTNPEYSKFFNLCLESDNALANMGIATKNQKTYQIFANDASQRGPSMNVRFFNTFHYTIYVPTNDEIDKAIANGLPTWEEIETVSETDSALAIKMANKLVKFIRYHFQDNSVFVDNDLRDSEGNHATSLNYETAALNDETDRFYTVTVKGGNNTLNVTDALGNAHNVLTSNSDSYNQMARDMKFNGTNLATVTTLETSSFIVIHQIDGCLNYPGQLTNGRYDNY